jgi:hypothetical protein
MRELIASPQRQSAQREMDGVVIAVSRSESHAFSKPCVDTIRLLAGLGVEGDAHNGATVKHRSRLRVDPSQPNLRQVHLIHSELLNELNNRGFRISAGQMGENITTRGIDLLGLPKGSRLYVGKSAVIEVTGLRNPCRQLEEFRPGLMQAVLARDEDGKLVRKAGVMAIVLSEGQISAGDSIRVQLPEAPHLPLKCV